MISWPAKDPADIADFVWAPSLDTGDTIATFTATVASGTIVKDSQSNTTTQGTVWLHGGTDRELAIVSLTITTAGGRTFKEAAVLPVFDRATAQLAVFRVRYPAFAALADGSVSYWLYEAQGVVDTTWASATQVPARAAWAAHMLESTGQNASALPAGVTQFKSGTFSAQIADGIASLKGLESTVYGREFLQMRRAQFAGPMLAWTPPQVLC